ncbi:MAG TPA: hypothetical protein VF771_00155 [Longimicrobiaceae bacterium]
MPAVNPKLQKLSLEQFKRAPTPHGAEALLSRFNGGTFMQCHQRIYAETGIWIPELVPVFQKLDATLALRELPRELQQ